MTHSSLTSNGASPAAAPLRKGEQKATSKYDANPSGIVVGLTLSLSWQLAIVVLVPVLGGHFLDDKLKTGLILTGIGFVIAMIGMILVVRQTLKQLNEYMKKSDDTEEHK
jgi:hypothetical protein